MSFFGKKKSQQEIDEAKKKKAKNKQKKREKSRREGEQHFLHGPVAVLNQHIPFHLGEKSGNYWKGNGYYIHQDNGKYCFKEEGQKDPGWGNAEESKRKERRKKMQLDNENCCPLGKLTEVYDDDGAIIKGFEIDAPKIPDEKAGLCNDPINYTNTLCSGGEVYSKKHGKGLCCRLGQTPDLVNGVCKEDYRNNNPEALAKRAQHLSEATGVTRMAVKGTVAAAGIGSVGTAAVSALGSGAAVTAVAGTAVASCLAFPPCWIVAAIALVLSAGYSITKLINISKDKNKMEEIVANGHELLKKLNKIYLNEEQPMDDGTKKKLFTEVDSRRAAGLISKLRYISDKLVKKPSDVGDEFVAEMNITTNKLKHNCQGKMTKSCLTNPIKNYSVEKNTETIRGYIGGKILARGNMTDGVWTDEKEGDTEAKFLKVEFFPRPDTWTSTVNKLHIKNIDNIRHIQMAELAGVEKAMSQANINYKYTKEKIEEALKDDIKNILEKYRKKGNIEKNEFEKFGPNLLKERIIGVNDVRAKGEQGMMGMLRKLSKTRDRLREYQNTMKEIKGLVDEIEEQKEACGSAIALEIETHEEKMGKILWARARNAVRAINAFKTKNTKQGGRRSRKRRKKRTKKRKRKRRRKTRKGKKRKKKTRKRALKKRH